jgi:hypothetical protein
LKEDVCGVKTYGTRRAAVERRTVDEHLPDEVAYACIYWVQHVARSGRQLRSNDEVHQFLEKHILHWIEAMSWLGKASDVIHNITALKYLVDVSNNLRYPRDETCLDKANRLRKANSYRGF